MDIFLAVLLFLVGAVVVAKGADFFVDASTWAAEVTGISKVLIGATLVAVATSGPELFVSLFASAQGQADMSTGNVIGSHLCNLGLGFALIAMFRPSKNSDRLYLANSLITLLTVVLILVFFFLGQINFVYGLILLAVFAAFTFINIRFASTDQQNADQLPLAATQTSAQPQSQPTTQNTTQSCTCQQSDSHALSQSAATTDCLVAKRKSPRVKKPTNSREIAINVAKFAFGLAAIIFGSKLIVDKATILAKAMGASEMIIGLTIVAVGTSLPEIVTTVAALIKKENDLGIGNIFGSCVFNNAMIIPLSAFVLGSLSFPSGVLIDLLAAIALTLITIIPTALGKKIYRTQGVAIITLYLSYIIYLVISA